MVFCPLPSLAAASPSSATPDQSETTDGTASSSSTSSPSSSSRYQRAVGIDVVFPAAGGRSPRAIRSLKTFSTPRLPPQPTTCTLEQRVRVFVLTRTGDGEHRLGHPHIASIRSALASVMAQAAANRAGSGAALVTLAEGRFFSNGLDISWAGTSSARLGELVAWLCPVAVDQLALPMPAVAAVTGHASTGGFLLALCHDYGVMRADHSVLYMSEVDIGLPLPPYFMALLCAKSTTAHALRDVVLRGRKIRAPEAKEMGIVDVVCPGAPETAAEELPARKWDGAVYASIRISIFLRPGGACVHCGGSGPASSFSIAHPAAPHHGSTLPRRHTEEVGRNWLIDAQSLTRFGFGVKYSGFLHLDQCRKVK